MDKKYKIFISNFPDTWGMGNFLEKYFEIVEVKYYSLEWLCYGTFKTTKDINKLVEELNNVSIDGKKIKVELFDDSCNIILVTTNRMNYKLSDMVLSFPLSDYIKIKGFKYYNDFTVCVIECDYVGNIKNLVKKLESSNIKITDTMLNCFLIN